MTIKTILTSVVLTPLLIQSFTASAYCVPNRQKPADVVINNFSQSPLRVSIYDNGSGKEVLSNTCYHIDDRVVNSRSIPQNMFVHVVVKDANNNTLYRKTVCKYAVIDVNQSTFNEGYDVEEDVRYC